MDPQRLAWRKSRHSGGHGHCVEVADGDRGDRFVRDSTDPGGPLLELSAAAWAALIAGIKGGEFDGTG